MPSLPNNTAFRNALQAMAVTGVKLHYDYPPQSLPEVPAAFLLPPGSMLGERSTSCIETAKTRRMGYFVALQAVMKDTDEVNYDLIAPAMDNLETALHSALNTIVNFYDFEMGSGTYTIGGVLYWGILADVTIRSTYG